MYYLLDYVFTSDNENERTSVCLSRESQCSIKPRDHDVSSLLRLCQ